MEVGRHPTNSWQHVAIVNIPSCKYQLNPLYISLTIRNFIFGLHYFTAQGSQVYCVSLDASKAFDRVLHSGLFMKLANRGISLSFIKLLKYWYSHLQCAVYGKVSLVIFSILHVELDKEGSCRPFYSPFIWLN